LSFCIVFCSVEEQQETLQQLQQVQDATFGATESVTRTLEYGTVELGTRDTEKLEQGTVELGTADTGQLEQGTVELGTEKLEQGTVELGTGKL
jgi:hypothetical protein